MNMEEICSRMEANGGAIGSLFDGLAVGQLGWRPAPEKWSLLEVLCHLHDEEVDDFRTRVDSTLHHPEVPWPAIDPQGWVRDRRHAEWDPETTMKSFRKRRLDSLHWLRSLDAPDWTAVHEHPQLGALSAGDLLLSWVTHDHLHIRQIVNLQLAFHREHGEPYSSRYAEP